MVHIYTRKNILFTETPLRIRVIIHYIRTKYSTLIILITTACVSKPSTLTPVFDFIKLLNLFKF